MKKLNQKSAMAVLFVAFLSLSAFFTWYNLFQFYNGNVVSYNEWNASLGSKFETDLVSNLWLKYHYVNFNGLCRKIFKQQEMNGVTKLNNGFLYGTCGLLPKETCNSFATNATRFKEFLAKNGVDYLYVTLPVIPDSYEPNFPLGVSDFSNKSLDNLKQAMQEHGIDTLDLREKLHEQDLKTYDIFYKTDHHWQTEGGFWAFCELVKYIEEKYGVDVDDKITNLENYSVTKYKNWHLGSNGQRTGKYYAGMDDFDLIIPKFETFIQRWGTNEGGTFPEMMINMKPLEKREYTSRYTYDSVMGGSCSNWHNPTASVDKTIVIIGDSMAKSVCPYLPLAFSNVLFIGDWDVHLIDKEYLKKFKPDIVISFYHLGWGSSPNAYNFYTE